MGYIRHHAIVVTSSSDKTLARAHAVALERFLTLTSPVIKSTMNGYASFFIGPDGSKEGWEESDKGDTERKWFLDYLDRQRFSDGSTSLKWAEVQYGDDDGISKVTRHSEETMASDEYSGPSELETYLAS